MSSNIERAAEVIDAALIRLGTTFPDSEIEGIAHDLADAGLLSDEEGTNDDQ